MFHVSWCQDSKPLPDKDYCLYQILPETCGNLHNRRNFLLIKSFSGNTMKFRMSDHEINLILEAEKIE